MDIQEQINLFEEGKYTEAFLGFIQKYNQESENTNKLTIMNILMEAYLLPVINSFEQNYAHNLKLLQNYPYLFIKEQDLKFDFDNFKFLLFPYTDDSYYIFDKEANAFIADYNPTTDAKMQYFFKDLSKAIQVHNEDNLYNLTFLFDNVRKSENVGCDNHIYLMYDDVKTLQRLMLVCKLDDILVDQKFVFLIGKENYNLYPLDFSQYGIDYSKIKPKKVQIDEVCRLHFWWNRAFCGSLLSLNLFNENPYLVSKLAFYRQEQYENFPFPFFLLPLFKNEENDHKLDFGLSFTIDELLDRYKSVDISKNYQKFLEFKRFLKQYDEKRPYSVYELFKLIFLYHYYLKHPKANPRIGPVLIWDPHIYPYQFKFTAFIKLFKYYSIFNSTRNPIIAAGRAYQYGKRIFLYNDYKSIFHMDKEFQKKYYSFKFEDIKQYPRETIKAICEYLNVPFDEAMLQTKAQFQTRNSDAQKEIVKGFDLAPLRRNVDSVFSKFDQARLAVFFEPIFKHFNYPCERDPNINFNTLASLLNQPFLFEEDYAKIRNETPDKVRKDIYANTMFLWKLVQTGNTPLPKLILPKFDKN